MIRPVFPIDKDNGRAAARITAAFLRIMLLDPPRDIGGDAGVKCPVGASDHVHMPHRAN